MVVTGLVVENGDDEFAVDEFSAAGGVLKDSFCLIEENVDRLLDFGGIGVGEDATVGLAFAEGIFFFTVSLIFLFLRFFFLFLQLQNFTISQVIIIHNHTHELIHITFGITIIDFVLAVHQLMQLMIAQLFIVGRGVLLG